MLAYKQLLVIGWLIQLVLGETHENSERFLGIDSKRHVAHLASRQMLVSRLGKYEAKRLVEDYQ